MTKSEFIEKARELGYTEEEIAETIQQVEDAKADGVIIPYDLCLVEKPIY